MRANRWTRWLAVLLVLALAAAPAGCAARPAAENGPGTAQSTPAAQTGAADAAAGEGVYDDAAGGPANDGPGAGLSDAAPEVDLDAPGVDSGGPDADPAAQPNAASDGPGEDGEDDPGGPGSADAANGSGTGASGADSAAADGPGADDADGAGSSGTDNGPDALTVTEDGWYNTKEEVALYVHLYGHLPDNYVTKRQAQDAGWTGGSVEPYTGEGTALGGSRFGNYEGLLPAAGGRSYTECDIGTVGRRSRGAKRLVFSNDGLIYYTDDHYETFELLYGGT